jgi:hypothetical protein
MASDRSLYERHRTTASKKTVEQWFAVTRYEAKIEKPLRFAATNAASSEKGKSTAERLAEQPQRVTCVERAPDPLQTEVG